MTETQKNGVIRFYDSHPINEDEILAKAAAQGASLDALTQTDLKDFDQDHYGGTEVLDALADAAEIVREHHVLDVCSGMGGPARWLAYQRNCKVTGLDFTTSRVEAARRLTQRVRLDHLVDFVHGDATAMPFPPSRYNVLIGQESWVHIPDKAALISECARVLKPGGNIAFTDIVVRSNLGQSTEKRLAEEMHTANIASAESYSSLLEENGCNVLDQDDLSGKWKDILVNRLEMFRSLRETTVEKFGESRYKEFDNAYSHFVGCFVANKLGGVRIVARKVA
jgi:ubiquinone/menaquinone biosynthesis C-methylase UbiE